MPHSFSLMSLAPCPIPSASCLQPHVFSLMPQSHSFSLMSPAPCPILSASCLQPHAPFLQPYVTSPMPQPQPHAPFLQPHVSILMPHSFSLMSLAPCPSLMLPVPYIMRHSPFSCPSSSRAIYQLHKLQKKLKSFIVCGQN